MNTSVSAHSGSCSAARSLAPFTSARFPSVADNVTVDLQRRLAAPALEPNPRGGLTEADQLRVGARPGREPLRPDMQRLEQIRLARAVRAHCQHETRLQRQPSRAYERKFARKTDETISRRGGSA